MATARSLALSRGRPAACERQVGGAELQGGAGESGVLFAAGKLGKKKGRRGPSGRTWAFSQLALERHRQEADTQRDARRRHTTCLSRALASLTTDRKTVSVCQGLFQLTVSIFHKPSIPQPWGKLPIPPNPHTV